MPAFTLGAPDNTFEKYHLSEYPLIWNSGGPQRSGYKAITQGNELVAILGENYKLFPNQEALKAADEIAQTLGFKPFNKGPFFAQGKIQMRSVERGEHVLFNKTGFRMAAFYADAEAVDLKPSGHEFDSAVTEKLHLGFTISNGIDGGRAFSAGSFTFRYACSNLAIVSAEVKTLALVHQRHTKSLLVSPKLLENTILSVVDRARAKLEDYRLWQQEELGIELAKKIVERLPEKYLPPQIETTKGKFTRLLGVPSIWDAYNEITSKLTRAPADFDRKEELYARIHAVLPKAGVTA